MLAALSFARFTLCFAALQLDPRAGRLRRATFTCDDFDLKELGLRKGVRLKILGTMRGWAAGELARLG